VSAEDVENLIMGTEEGYADSLSLTEPEEQ